MNFFILARFKVIKTKLLSQMPGENRGMLLFFPIVFIVSYSQLAISQTLPTPNLIEKLHVIRSSKEYMTSVKSDSSKKMVLLKRIIPQIIVDLKYATAANFTHQVLYKNPQAYLRCPAAAALKKVNKELCDSGLALKIFDAYRPYNVTKKMWKVVQDHRYVANPAKGSGHNRGASVDLTLVQLSTGKELSMGTGFDDFTEKAGHHFTNFPATILHNRALLKKIMQKHGFLSLQTEWWHYIFAGAEEKFELLDLSFEELEILSQ